MVEKVAVTVAGDFTVAPGLGLVDAGARPEPDHAGEVTTAVNANAERSTALIRRPATAPALT